MLYRIMPEPQHPSSRRATVASMPILKAHISAIHYSPESLSTHLIPRPPVGHIRLMRLNVQSGLASSSTYSVFEKSTMSKRSSFLLRIRRPRRRPLSKCSGSLRKYLILSLIAVAGGRLSVTDIGHADGMTWWTLSGHLSKVTYTDHATINFNSGTVAFVEDGARRQIFLEEGEIHLALEHGISKPTDVHIGSAVLFDLGTNFNVSTHANIVSVSVADGSVRVHEIRPDGRLADPIDVTGASHQRHPLILKQGDLSRLEQREGSVLAYVGRNDTYEAKARTAWEAGELQTSGRRLDEVVQEFNRHGHVKMIIGDAMVAQMIVGGRYSLIDVQGFLSNLQRLGVEAIPVTEGDQDVGEILLLSAAATDPILDPPHPGASKGQ